jgi:prolipoprotein diacylglyceryltransferase
VNGEFGEKVLRMPWWSVEMMLNLMLFGVMWLVQLKPRGRTSRVLVGMYLVGYGLIRLVMESFRERSWEVMGLGVAQWAAMLSIVVGLSIWYKAARD